MKRTLSSIFLVLALIAAPVRAADVASVTPSPTVDVASVSTYQIDPVHSEMTFRIRHLMGRVFGAFTDWEGTVTVDPNDLSTLNVDVTVQTASINTFNEQRDEHLRTDDFFDAANHPTMTFTSNNVVVNGDAVNVHGDLTIRGTTRPVVLTGEYLGQGGDPWGGERIAFVATTTIDRQDFNVHFNQIVEGVGMIGDEVEISLAIEAVRQ